ncbi:hypothetical protein BDA96_07G191800 [Sorghum bicolor]|uniref:Secreted protein n=1 Tax=Sorghum bicolor TaxID=4558 RepID=A0A921QPA5_SORBI|nr:hypothetical protein BDA96_07G191800 [Sorghum bicolor]
MCFARCSCWLAIASTFLLQSVCAFACPPCHVFACSSLFMISTQVFACSVNFRTKRFTSILTEWFLNC